MSRGWQDPLRKILGVFIGTALQRGPERQDGRLTDCLDGKGCARGPRYRRFEYLERQSTSRSEAPYPMFQDRRFDTLDPVAISGVAATKMSPGCVEHRADGGPEHSRRRPIIIGKGCEATAVDRPERHYSSAP